MIPYVDSSMNGFACFQAPIIDVLSEIGFIGFGLTGLYGVYRSATGLTIDGLPLIATGIIGLFTTSYTKEISQMVGKSCKV